MAFTEYLKTANSPLVVGKTSDGQYVGFETGDQFTQSGGNWGAVKIVNTLPSYINYSAYNKPAGVTPATSSSPASIQMPAGYTAPAPSYTMPSQTNIYQSGAGYTGPSLVDFLTASGQPSTFSARQQLASKYGVAGYQGTAGQNTQLLSILKGYATGQTTPTGVPTTMSSPGTVPLPNSAIPANSLQAPGLSDLSKILGANLPAGTVSSDIAGLLSLYGMTTDSQKQYDEISKQLTDAMGSLGQEGADLQQALKDQGVFAAYEQVKQLNLKAAQLQGELGKFDAETLQGKSTIEEQAIPTGLILGQQGQFQKQRDLTRISKTAELSATIALSQAYQGNAQIGMELASKAVDLKYMPVLNQIEVLKTQLALAGDKMSREDSNRAKIIDNLLNFKISEINDQKAREKEIQALAIQAASNGAPLNIVNAMRSAKDSAGAAAIAGQYLKGSLESVPKDGNATVANLGNPVGESFGFPTYDTAASNPGMTRPNRNNNPGNIKASAYSVKFAGVIGVESRAAQDGGNFLIFDSPESGKAAIGRLLREGRSYQGVTADQAMRAYSGGGYGGADVGLAGGTNFQQQIADPGKLAALVDAIAKREGFTGGTTFDKDTSTNNFTTTQLNKGAANAGIPISQFSTYSDDVKNYFINGFSSFESAIKQVEADTLDPAAVVAEIDSTNLPQEIKDNLKKRVPGATQEESSGGGFLSGVGDLVGGAYNTIKNWLGF